MSEFDTHDTHDTPDTALVVGIDIAASTFVPALWLPRGGQVLPTLPNQETGFEHLAQALEAQRQALGVDVIHLTLEATGGYEAPLAYFAHQHGWRVSVVNAATVRHFLQAHRRRAKTDPLDALGLAQYTAEQHPPLWTPPEPALAALDSLWSRRRDVQSMLQAERNRQQQFQLRPQVAPVALDSLARTIAHLAGTLAEIEQAIAEVVQSHPPLSSHAERLDTLPGVGAKTIPPLLALAYAHGRSGQRPRLDRLCRVGCDRASLGHERAQARVDLQNGRPGDPQCAVHGGAGGDPGPERPACLLRPAGSAGQAKEGGIGGVHA